MYPHTNAEIIAKAGALTQPPNECADDSVLIKVTLYDPEVTYKVTFIKSATAGLPDWAATEVKAV